MVAFNEVAVVAVHLFDEPGEAAPGGGCQGGIQACRGLRQFVGQPKQGLVQGPGVVNYQGLHLGRTVVEIDHLHFLPGRKQGVFCRFVCRL